VAPEFKSFIHEERLTKDEIRRFKSMLTEQNLAEFVLDSSLVRNTQDIDTWMNDQAENRQVVLD